MKTGLIGLLTVVLMSVSTAVAGGDAVAGKATYNACVGCHGAKDEGGVGSRLVGKSAEDFISKMHKYQNGETVDPMSPMMAPSAQKLQENDIQNLASFIQTL